MRYNPIGKQKILDELTSTNLALKMNGVDYLKGEKDIYLDVETLKTEQPAKDYEEIIKSKELRTKQK